MGKIVEFSLVQIMFWISCFLMLFLVVFFWSRKRLNKNKPVIPNVDEDNFGNFNLAPLVSTFSELDEIEKVQLSTMLTDIFQEPHLLQNSKVKKLRKFIQKKVDTKMLYRSELSTFKTSEDAFKKRLLEKHFNLTEQDVEFCKYVIQKKTIAEISLLTDLTEGTVRVYKNRLKIKLNLPSNERISTYLSNI